MEEAFEVEEVESSGDQSSAPTFQVPHSSPQITSFFDFITCISFYSSSEVISFLRSGSSFFHSVKFYFILKDLGTHSIELYLPFLTRYASTNSDIFQALYSFLQVKFWNIFNTKAINFPDQ